MNYLLSLKHFNQRLLICIFLEVAALAAAAYVADVRAPPIMSCQPVCAAAIMQLQGCSLARSRASRTDYLHIRLGAHHSMTVPKLIARRALISFLSGMALSETDMTPDMPDLAMVPCQKDPRQCLGTKSADASSMACGTRVLLLSANGLRLSSMWAGPRRSKQSCD